MAIYIDLCKFSNYFKWPNGSLLGEKKLYALPRISGSLTKRMVEKDVISSPLYSRPNGPKSHEESICCINTGWPTLVGERSPYRFFGAPALRP